MAIKHYTANISKEGKESDSNMREIWNKIWANHYSSRDIPDLEEVIDTNEGVLNNERFKLMKQHGLLKGIALEAGCGTGSWILALEYLGVSTIGVDFEIEVLKKLKAKYPNLNLVCCDNNHMPFKESTFNTIMSWGVVEHFEEGPDTQLDELHRILSPGGHIAINVPLFSPISYLSPIKLWNYLKTLPIIDSLRKWFNKPSRCFFEFSFTKKEFSKILANHNFKIKANEPCMLKSGIEQIWGRSKIGKKNAFNFAQKNKNHIFSWICAAHQVYICKK